MIGLSEPYILGNAWKYIKECLDTGWVSSAGEFVERFEKCICKYTGAKYAVSCVNGTSGLFISLLLAGVKPNDEVIVPTLTFIAPVNAVKYLHAEPIFMDCDNYMNIDANKLEEFLRQECKFNKDGIRNKKSGRAIKAIVVVHVFGNPCSMEHIMEIARKHNLKVIEDAAESIGSYYTGGVYRMKFTGTIGDFGVYSFNGNKIITAGGGGMMVTANKEMAEKARYLTTQGKNDSIRYIHNEVGYNFRLSNLQSALGIAQLEKLDEFIKIKKMNYMNYKDKFERISGIELLGIPEKTRPNYWFYSLIIDKYEYGIGNEELMRKLLKKGIETRPIWYLNHFQKPYYNNQAYKIEKAVWFLERTLNIPCSSNLTKDELKEVVSAIESFKKIKNI